MSSEMQNEKLRFVDQAGSTEPMPPKRKPMGLQIAELSTRVKVLLEEYPDIPPYIVSGVLLNFIISPIVVGTLGEIQRHAVQQENQEQEEAGNSGGGKVD